MQFRVKFGTQAIHNPPDPFYLLDYAAVISLISAGLGVFVPAITKHLKFLETRNQQDQYYRMISVTFSVDLTFWKTRIRVVQKSGKAEVEFGSANELRIQLHNGLRRTSSSSIQLEPAAVRPSGCRITVCSVQDRRRPIPSAGDILEPPFITRLQAMFADALFTHNTSENLNCGFQWLSGRFRLFWRFGVWAKHVLTQRRRTCAFPLFRGRGIPVFGEF